MLGVTGRLASMANTNQYTTTGNDRYSITESPQSSATTQTQHIHSHIHSRLARHNDKHGDQSLANTHVPATQEHFSQQTMPSADIPTQPNNTQKNHDVQNYNWSVVPNRKRRLWTDLQNVITLKRQASNTDYWLNNPTTNNKFATLTDTNMTESDIIDIDVDENKSTEKNINAPKSPPIFVCGVEYISPLKVLLDQIAKEQYTLKVLSNKQIKIQPENTDKYLIITTELEKRGTQFYTYQHKQLKSFKVVIRGLHPTTDINEIKAEVEQYGHKVLHIANMISNQKKTPIPLFFVEIKQQENNADIYGIKRLLHTVVNIEQPHKKRDIPQCMRCQSYGHTKNYCNRSPQCVKCAGKHLTSNCNWKSRNQEVKCCNCSGNHPASYKGCIMRKKLIEKVFPKLRERGTLHGSSISPRTAPNNKTNYVNKNKTYAAATNTASNTSNSFY